MFVDLASSRHWAISLATWARKSSGPLPTGSTPSLSKRAWVSGAATMRRAVSASRAITGSGVPAGAAMAIQR
jgi:hypothetical protein